MKNFTPGQLIVVPSGRTGKIKVVSGNQATVWFDEDGLDVGYFSLATLTYPKR